ncbi:hypothetical protein XAP6164_1780003 [Xanthomonas phaseoli pv. phaseoli]|nr:hypothetical protein XAP6164_1780003 [Xanthomonas phaseoli pv. phaseoli]
MAQSRQAWQHTAANTYPDCGASKRPIGRGASRPQSMADSCKQHTSGNQRPQKCRFSEKSKRQFRKSEPRQQGGNFYYKARNQPSRGFPLHASGALQSLRASLQE